MNIDEPLSPVLRAKFSRLERRIRRTRWLRSLAACTLALTGSFVFAFMFDVTVGWSVLGLRLVNFVMLAAAVVGAGAVLVAWRRSLTGSQLAALVERCYPQFDERLASTVELQQAGSTTHGSIEMIQGLLDETVDRATPLDFQSAYRLTATRKLLAATLGLLLVALAPLLGSESYARFARRLVLAWSPSAHGYEVIVHPGEQYVGRGRSAAVTARLAATDSHARLPSQCTVVVDGGDGSLRRLRMEVSESGVFSYTWPAVAESFSYRVEGGDVASATYRLEAIDPVALTPGSPSARVTPPPYVNPKVVAAAEHQGHVPFAALQFSRISFAFAMDRPAQKATIRWRADDKEQSIQLALSPDRRQADWDLLAAQLGPHAATLTLEAEHGIVSTYPLPPWSVWADDAPWFSVAPTLGVSDNDERPKSLAPVDVIPIKIVAEDQVGLDRVELEYRINDGAVQRWFLADGQGQTRVDVDKSWTLPSQVKIGDTVQCRLLAVDNRRLTKGELRCADQSAPDTDLTPHITYLPSSANNDQRWWSFKIERQAEPLAKQLVLAQRDEFKDWIERIKKQLDQERQLVQKVKSASHQMPVLSADQANQLSQAHKLNQANQQELRALGQKAAQVEGLQNLARLGFDIARRELGDSDQALSASRTKSLAAEPRERELNKADQALASALKRLDELNKVNELLAQERLSVQELEKLAGREQELAKQAEELAAQANPDPKELERLRAEQAKIAARLQQLAEQNPRLQQAARQLQKDQAQKLSKQAQSLAMQQRRLSADADAKWDAKLKEQFAGLAQKQRELAGNVQKLGNELKNQPATAPLETPHRPALNAADRLRDGQVEPAQADQKTAEDALRALAEQLDKAHMMGRDPRSNALKLAKLQDDLLKQLHKVGDDFRNVPLEQTRKRLTEITQEQKKLHDAVGKLDVPKSAEAGRKGVQDMTGAASDLLQKKDPYEASLKMVQARDALQALARSLPDTAPIPTGGKVSPEEIAAKKQADQARQLAKDQQELREAVAKMLKGVAKSQGESPQQAQQKDEVNKLAQELMKLSQSAGPEAKQAAKDAAHAAAEAQKAMAKSKSDKEDGRPGDAKQGEAEAALQLEMAGKKLDEAAQAMPGKSGGDAKEKADDAALQQALNDSQMKLDRAGRQLQEQPKNAAPAMQQAAKALQQTAKQAQNQMNSQPQPMGGGDPASSFQPGGPGSPADFLPDQLKEHAGKTWGELPGELRTRIVQDLRARYGDEYGPIIQRYFQQIADVPGTKKPK